MIKKEIEIQGSCTLEVTTWEGTFEPQACINYIEYGDHWHGNTESCADIDKETAIKMVELLQDTFNI